MDSDIPTLLRPTSAFRSYERESKQTLERVKQKSNATSGRPSFGFPRNVDHYDVVYVLDHTEQQKEELRTSGMKFGRPPPKDIFSSTAEPEDDPLVRTMRTSRSPTMMNLNQQELSREKKDGTKSEMNGMDSVLRNIKTSMVTQNPLLTKQSDKELLHKPSTSRPMPMEKLSSIRKISQSRIEASNRETMVGDKDNNSSSNSKPTSKSKISVIKMPSNPVLAVLKSRPKTTPSPSRSKPNSAGQKPLLSTLPPDEQSKPLTIATPSDFPRDQANHMEFSSENDKIISSPLAENWFSSTKSSTPNGTKIVNLRVRHSFHITPDQQDSTQKNLSLFFMASSEQGITKVPSSDSLPIIVNRDSLLQEISSGKQNEEDIREEMNDICEIIVQKQRTKSEITLPFTMINSGSIHEEVANTNAVDEGNINPIGAEANDNHGQPTNSSENMGYFEMEADNSVAEEENTNAECDIFPESSTVLVGHIAEAVVSHAIAIAIEDIAGQSHSSNINAKGDDIVVNTQSVQDDLVPKESVQNQIEIVTTENVQAYYNEEEDKSKESRQLNENMNAKAISPEVVENVSDPIPEENTPIVKNTFEELPFGTIFDGFLQRYLNPSVNITENKSSRKRSKHKNKHKQNNHRKHDKGKSHKKKIADEDFFSSDSSSCKEEGYEGDADETEFNSNNDDAQVFLKSSSQQAKVHRHNKTHVCDTCSMLRREKQMLKSMYKSWREVRRLHRVIQHGAENKEKKKESGEGEEELSLPPEQLLSLCLQEMIKLSVESHQAVVDCYRAIVTRRIIK